ncbi:MAG: 50S ribosomal protein L18 [Bacteroidetes bacterium HGW-Bacteroidetes-4]|jgi:large subunit ribosomal protein L18|nr:MAG: 50S ribosomal protein L18 [Bacteroidetes bacterium HGW-Bacteroidetes-4]
MAFDKKIRRQKIKENIRKKISGTSEMPRMSVYRSNKQISVQIIDDVAQTTLAAASSLNKEIAEFKGNKTQQADKVGELVARLALEKGITQVVFDRNGYLYHGRVKALAEAARKGGLKF